VGELAGARPPPAADQPRGSRPAQRRPEVAAAQGGQRVGVARAREQRRRPDQHVTADGPREVHAEERQRRVRHRVDLPAHELRPREPQVGAAERDDPHVGPRAGRRGEAVRPGARAGHGPPRAHGRRAPVEHRLHVIRPLEQRANAVADPDLAPVRPHVVRVGGGHRAVVDHPRVRRVQCREAARRRLDRGDLVRPEPRHPLHPVRLRSALELVEPGEVGVAHGHHELPAALHGDPALRAVRVERGGALHAQPRLQRPGRVVEAGVDHAAVVAGLVRAEPVLPLEHDDPPSAQRELPGGGQPDDPPARDRDVVH
jgi:hypothetical protein